MITIETMDKVLRIAGVVALGLVIVAGIAVVYFILEVRRYKRTVKEIEELMY